MTGSGEPTGRRKPLTQTYREEIIYIHSNFDAKHVPGILSLAADGISLLRCASVLVNLRAVQPHIMW